MKAFSLWLFRLCWRREINRVAYATEHGANYFGLDYQRGFENGASYALDVCCLKEPK